MTIVAIDFGTSNTVVALLEADTQAPRSLSLGVLTRRFAAAVGKQLAIVPTLVYVPQAPPLLFGEQVRSQRLQYVDRDRTFTSFKRGLAADFMPPPRHIAEQAYDVPTITQQFLDRIWAEILAQGVEPSQLILTVPVGSFERYLDFLQQWSQGLNVPVVRFIDESTAAALNYGVPSTQSVVLVIDWGGGTLDLSLVRLNFDPHAMVSQAQVVAKADAYLGGEDIDRALLADYRQGEKVDDSPITTARLLELAEQLKIRLSQVEHATESWLDEATFQAYEWHLERDRLTDILEAQGFLEQLRQSLDEVLHIAQSQGLGKSDITQVVMVGGTCLLPPIQDLVTAYFGRSRVNVDQPFTAVSYGAIALTQIQTVQDYLQHSYAIQLWDPHIQDYTYYPLFAKGTYYPCLRPESLTLQAAQDGQDEVRLNIGEIADSQQTEVSYDALGRLTSQQRLSNNTFHALQPHNNEICIARLNPHGIAGRDRLQLDFEVDAQRMLRATVKDLLTQTVLVDRGAIARLE
ncbi:MAG: Hsp70 family protein [Spirulina sp. SIO3F2]|nr:Hsp70 family protein [Spirulina sp. SIO3F2]